MLVQTVLHNCFRKYDFFAHVDFDGKICELGTTQQEFFISDSKKMFISLTLITDYLMKLSLRCLTSSKFYSEHCHLLAGAEFYFSALQFEHDFTSRLGHTISLSRIFIALEEPVSKQQQLTMTQIYSCKNPRNFYH